MATIKAGRYKFNDTISIDDFAGIDGLPFTIAPTIIGGVTWTCGAFNTIGKSSTGISFWNSDGTSVSLFKNGTEYGSYLIYDTYNTTNGWSLTVCTTAGEEMALGVNFGQIIIVTEDTEVDEASATCFSVSMVEIPTEESVRTKIQSLIDKANTTTGKDDDDLTDAMLSLVAGYGQGGSGGGTGNLIEKTIRNNGEYNAFTDNADGFSRVLVAVGEPTSEEVSVVPAKSEIEVTPTKAEYISKVTVAPIPDTYIQPSGTATITENGTYDVTEKAEVVVAVLGTSESPIPTDIASEGEMTAILSAADLADNGRIYRYVGETGKYIKNAYYKIGVREDG